MFAILAIVFPIISLIVGVAVFVATIQYVKAILAVPKSPYIPKS